MGYILLKEVIHSKRALAKVPPFNFGVLFKDYLLRLGRRSPGVVAWYLGPKVPKELHSSINSSFAILKVFRDLNFPFFPPKFF